jgi:release factor glutamine methyltransferase
MNNNITVSEIRVRIKQTLKGLYDDNEIRNFIYLIFHRLLNYSKIDIQLKGNEVISQQFLFTVDNIMQRLKKYEPIQYILGATEFFGLPLVISQDVMIPRPETEELTDWIIRENGEKSLRILDIGTGSGCIAVTLAKMLPLMQVTGIDIIEKALETARKNAVFNKVNVVFLRFDVLGQSPELKGEFDIIVSNPPYVRKSEKKIMKPNVLMYEPHKALFVPDNNPLLFYKAIADLGNLVLAENGNVYCEINEALPEETAEVFRSRDYPVIEIRRDINFKPRMIKAGKK